MACLHIQVDFQRQWRSKEKASDKAIALGAGHINNLETVKCKNSQMQVLKESQGFQGEYSLRQETATVQGKELSLPPSLEDLENMMYVGERVFGNKKR